MLAIGELLKQERQAFEGIGVEKFVSHEAKSQRFVNVLGRLVEPTSRA